MNSRRKTASKTPQALQIPGARPTSMVVKDSSLAGGRSANKEITANIHEYLNVVFSAALSYAIHASRQMNVNPSTLNTIPTIVREILAYNNVHFDDIIMFRVREDSSTKLFEPIWYIIQRHGNDKRYLFLFVDELFYHEYAAVNTLNEVFFKQTLSFEKPTQEFTYDNVPLLMNTALVKIIVACDHVALHILHELYNKDAAKMDISTNDIHDCWNDDTIHVGVTLHSFLRLTVVENSELVKMLGGVLTRV
ncbi:gp13-like protein [Phenacoccus solenopsis nudivirus]|nr:gp13-like protein [Phenacoccus solenopsis nudivirus]